MSTPEPNAAERNVVAILAGDSRYREELGGALLSFYRTEFFATPADALSAMRESRPSALVVSDTLPPEGGCAFIRSLRRVPEFADLPVLLTVDEYSIRTRDLIHSCGATAWLAKPFRRSQLTNALSKLVNGGVELHWEKLPALQRKVLNLTVKIFDTLSNKIYKGEPLPMSSIQTACRPLIESIHTSNYKLILNAVNEHDNFTYVHSLRVATLLAIFGYAIGLPNEDQLLLASGGLLHDVGKMYIPFDILNKAVPLTTEEFEVMKKHVTYTIRYLNTYKDIPRGIAVIAGQHHERLDGSGYPEGLQGSQINDLARMAGIVDVFCALTDRRPYRPAMQAEEALNFMHDTMALQLDTRLLRTFRDTLLDAASGKLETAKPPSAAPDPEPVPEPDPEPDLSLD